MKKFALSLLLVALCLSLAACELPFDLPFELPFGPFADDQNDNMLYALLECEDYAGALKCVTTAAQSPAENEITNTEALQAEYPELAALINDRDYDGAYCYVLSLYHKSGLVLKEWSVDLSPTTNEIVFTDWYTASLDDALPQNIRFSQEGTCSFMGQTYYWRITGASGTKDCMLPVFELHDGIEPKYRVDFNYFDSADMYCLWIRDSSETLYANYVHEKVDPIDLNGTWLTVDTQFTSVQKVEIAGDRVFLNDFPYIVKSSYTDMNPGENGISIHVALELWNEKYDQYRTLNFLRHKGAMEATMVDDESQRTVRYYKSGPDYDHAVMVSDYERALDVLSCLKGSDNGLDYNGDVRSRQEWFDYIYKAMVAADGYGESEKILSNFTVLEDLLVGIGTLEENTSYFKEYRYDSAGRLIFANDRDLTLYFYYTPEIWSETNNETGPWDIPAHHYYYEYDMDGRVSKILHKDWDRLYATITPTYDNRGNVKTLEIKLASGETRTVKFTYEYDIWPSTVEDEWYEDEWEEDEGGEKVDLGNALLSMTFGERFLDFAWIPNFDGYLFAGTDGWITVRQQDASYSDWYFYDENEVLTGKKITVTMTDENSNLGYTEEYVYTYDDLGRVASEKVTTTDGSGNSWTVTYYYVYQNVYFYNFDAE